MNQNQFRRVPPPPTAKRNPTQGGPKPSNKITPPVYLVQQSIHDSTKNQNTGQSAGNQKSLQNEIQVIDSNNIKSKYPESEQIKGSQTKIDYKNQTKNVFKINEQEKQLVQSTQHNKQPDTTELSQKVSPTFIRKAPPQNTGRRNPSQQKKRVNPPEILPPIPVNHHMQNTQENDEKKNVTKIQTTEITEILTQTKFAQAQTTQFIEETTIRLKKQILTPSNLEQFHQSIQNQTVQQLLTTHSLQSENKRIGTNEQPIIKTIPPPVSKPSLKKTNPPKPPTTIKPVQKKIEVENKDETNQENIEPRKYFDQNQDSLIQTQKVSMQNENKQELTLIKRGEVESPKKRSSVPPKKVQISSSQRQNQDNPIKKEQIMKKKHEQGKNLVNVSQKNNQNEMRSKQKNLSTISGQYNQLQQKLRRLEELRQKMNQSSQDQYQNQNEGIEYEQQLEVSPNGSQENIIKGETSRNNYQNLNQQQLKQDTHVQQFIHKQFTVGQTNYEEMEIKDQNYHQNITTQIQNKDQQSHSPAILKDNILLSPLDQVVSSSSSQQQDSTVPVPAETVYQSNLSVQETRRQYLPDQVSLSPMNSEESMAKHHLLAPQTGSNIVYHANNHHSEANFGKPSPYMQKQQDEINQQLFDGGISEKSDGELAKPKHQTTKNQHNHRAKNESIQSNYNQSNNQNVEMNNKENHYTTKNQSPMKEARTYKNKESNIGINIDQMLREFKSKKLEYFKNLQNMKKSQLSYQMEEETHRQRISELMSQVNHKNLLILRHSNGSNGQTEINDKYAKMQDIQEL